MKLHFFIGYDSKEDIAYRVCKHSLLKHSTIDVKVVSLDVLTSSKYLDLSIAHLFIISCLYSLGIIEKSSS